MEISELSRTLSICQNQLLFFVFAGIRTPEPEPQPEPNPKPPPDSQPNPHPDPQPEPKPQPEPDHCNRDLVFDAVTHIGNDLYFFKNG